MATKANELFTKSTSAAKIRMEARYVGRHKFLKGAGTFVAGAAVSHNTTTGLWTVWDGNGSGALAIIDGFVYGDDVVLDADDEVLATVMTQGSIHYDDLLEINVTEYGTAGELQAEIRSDAFRQKNLTVIGYSGAAE